MNYKGRAIGGFYVLAIGDALGGQVEFKQPGTFEPVTEMTGGGYFNLRPGQFTDDTQMALIMAKSLDENNGFNALDLMSRFLSWYDSPECFDIGDTIRRSLERFRYEREPYQGLEYDQYSGNGSIMRLYPGLLFTMYMKDENAFNIVWDISRLTHASSIVKEQTSIMFHLIRKLFKHGDSLKKETALEGLDIPDRPMNTEFVTDTLQAALWGFKYSDSFEEGLLKVVNLGGDSDTIGAVYGQIAGTWYGSSEIPVRFIKQLEHNEEIRIFALKLLAPNRSMVSNCPTS